MPKSPRRLAERDRSVWELEQVVAARFDDCDGFEDRYEFPDLTTQVPFVLYLSQEEFTKLYSAVLAGADLAYPNQSHTVEYLFLQMVNCVMSELCQAVADCITNSENTQLAINAYLSGQSLTGGVGDGTAPLSSSILGANLLPPGYTCSDDDAFGMALAIVDSINAATTEVLQLIETATNYLELANELADNVPGVGVLASAGDVVSWVQNVAQEEYELAWSVTTRDELACLLWCKFKFVCDLSFDDIWQTYLDASGAAPPSGDTLEEWITWLLGLAFGDDLQTVALISMLGLMAMRHGGSHGNFTLGIRSLETVMALAEDDTSSDWSIVCPTCIQVWCYEFDFTLGMEGWTFATLCGDLMGEVRAGGLGSVGGVYSAGCSQLAQYLYIDITFDNTTTLTSVEIESSGTKGNSDDKHQYFADGGSIHNDGDNTEIYDAETNHVVGGLDVEASDMRIALAAAQNGSQAGDIFLIKLILRGTGTPPFDPPNC